MSVIDRWLGLDPFDIPQEAIEWLLTPATDRRHVAIALMARELRQMGYTVIRSPYAPPPHPGDCWEPTRGLGKRTGTPKLRPRWVRSVGDTKMSYAPERNGMGIMIDRVSWDAWVRKTRARRV